MPHKEVDLAYIAGLIDGEGYVGLVKQIEKRRSRISVYYEPKVCIAMCDKVGIDFIANKFSCNIWYKEMQNERWRNQWHLRIKGRKRLKEFLLAIYPYLHVKRRQAELMLEFINLREKAKQPKWGETSYTIKEHEMYLDFRELNKKGPREV